MSDIPTINKILVLGAGCREFSIITKLKTDNPDLILHYSCSKENYILSKIAKFIDINYIKVEYLDYDLILAGPEKYCGSFLNNLNVNLDKTLLYGPMNGNELLEFSKIYTRNIIKENYELFTIECNTSNNKNNNSYIPNPEYVFYDNLSNYSDMGTLETTIIEIKNKCFEFINKYNGFVIKPDGLTGGKGVKIYPQHFNNLEEAIQYMLSLDDKFLIEELLDGREYSLMAFTDGKTLQFMPQVQDYKRAYNNNLGPNTGSMGSVCMGLDNLYFLTDDDLSISKNIMNTTIDIMDKVNKNGYIGVLYGSFIKTVKGEIKLIEYNVRLGDPECVNVMSLLETPLLDIVISSCQNNLNAINIKWKKEYNTVLYLTPYNYPIENKVIKPVNYPNKITSFLNEVIYTNTSNYYDINFENYIKNYNSILDMENITSRICYYTNDIKISSTHNDFIPNKSRTGCFCISNNNLEELVKDYKKLCYYLDFFIDKYFMKYSIRFRNDILDNYVHNAGQYIYSQQGGIDTQNIGNTLLNCKQMIAKTYNDAVISEFGSFGGEYKLPGGEHTLIASTDGVGTRTIALRSEFGVERAAEIAGQDIVNHNINDILVNGGVPLFFLDYFGCAQFNEIEFQGLISGITKSCVKYNTVLLGGETAVMRDVYREGEIDIVGTIVGRKEFNFYRQYEPGTDILVGLDASGFHTNGFSFLRKIWHSDFIKGLTEPHRCYLNEIRELLYNGVNIKALAHITGGGFYDNINRVIPRSQYELNISSIKLPDYYKPILDAGYTKLQCMEILNCGVGLVMIIAREDWVKVIGRCSDARIIGYVC